MQIQMEVQMEPRLDIYLKIGAAAVAGVWGGAPPVLQLLLILMALDIASGILAAFINRELSSSISFRGVTKKTLALLLVGAGAALENYLGLPVDLDAGIAGFYAANELLSIIENAARTGLPVPQVLRDVLVKLNPQADVTPKPAPHG